jgi:myo-inositol-1(or 4)-monophosphatase
MPESKPDLDRALSVAVTAGKAAGAIQEENFGRDIEIGYKGRIDVITSVDLQCEREIIRIIHAAFPDHAILAEEESIEARESKYKWIVDPLDGTVNYSHGFPMFSSSIGLEVEGEMVLGVVYDPMRDELFTAKRGEGAFLNGRPIRVSETVHVEQSLLSTGFSYHIREIENKNLDHFARFALRAQSIRRTGSATLDLCYVAMGRLDGFWEMNLFPWDMAAAGLILEEAGGQLSLTDGEPFSLYRNEIVGSNGSIHREMLEILKIDLKPNRPIAPGKIGKSTPS